MKTDVVQLRGFAKTLRRAGRFFCHSAALENCQRTSAPAAAFLLLGAIYVAFACHSAFTMIQAAYLFFVLSAVCAFDARYGIIPDVFVILLAVGGVASLLCGSAPFDIVWRGTEVLICYFGAIFLRSTYRFVRGVDGLGFGDVKFVTAAVILIGLEDLPMLLLAATFSAFCGLALWSASGERLSRDLELPFGPHLAVGFWVSWIINQTPLL